MHIINMLILEATLLITKLDVRNAFKVNAWMQIKDMSSNDAKQEYIKLAKSLLNIKN